MTNPELTLDQLQDIAGGNCTDTEKKEVKAAKFDLICSERFQCPDNDAFPEEYEKESDAKKSSKPIPFVDDGQDSWASER